MLTQTRTANACPAEINAADEVDVTVAVDYCIFYTLGQTRQSCQEIKRQGRFTKKIHTQPGVLLRAPKLPEQKRLSYGAAPSRRTSGHN